MNYYNKLQNHFSTVSATSLMMGVLLLSGCTMAPWYKTPDVQVPSQWSKERASEPKELRAQNAAVPSEEDFWQRFHNAELRSLVAQALERNNDIQAGIARVEQARAQTRVASSALFPSASVSGGASQNRTEPPTGAASSGSSGRAQGNVSYELDVFGKNRSNSRAAGFRAEATEFNQQALELIITAEVAQTYAELLALEDRMKVAADNLRNSREVLDIINARFNEGASSALEVAQQKTALAGNLASYSALELQRDAARNALAVLVDETPQGFSVHGQHLDAIAVPEVATGQPSELLQRRPDIQRAESELKAANADIGAARAAFFPSINLGGEAGFALAPLSGGATALTSLGASLTAPIFQGGRLLGLLEVSEARKRELIENYQQAVLVSFREVEDALSSEQAAGARVRALDEGAEQARLAYKLARERYDAGVEDYLTLLDAQRSRLAAEDEQIRARLERVVAALDLYKAIGGAWK